MNVLVYNLFAERISGAHPIWLGATISVHGINTLGPWQKHINTVLQDNFIRDTPLDYGFQRRRAFRLFTKGLLREVADKLIAAYLDQRNHHPTPSAIGHSFGTLAIGTTLQQNPDLQLRRIVLFGSILPRDFPWRKLADRDQVERVLNETCSADRWARRAGTWIAGAGPSGCEGFMSDGGGVVTQSPYEWTDHSELGTPLHCKPVWVPFILG